MDDLISRQALLKAMEKKYDVANVTGMYPLGLSEAFIITERIIQEQPTAYDVDKVVEQFKSLINAIGAEERTSCEGFECVANDCIECMILHCIEFVKGVVKDE